MTPRFEQGDFQTSANMTPQQIERKRALMAALMPRFGSAKYVGEGLGQLFTGIGMGLSERKLDERENANRQEGDDLFQRILSGASSRQPQGGTGFSILGQAPLDEGKSLANDTMAAIGKHPMGQPSSISDSLARTESGGKYGIVNSEGYTGKYQWGQSRLDDFNRANGTQYSLDQFRETPQLQEQAQAWHENDIMSDLGGYIGQEVNGIKMTPGAIVAMAHLGGKDGARRFIESGGAYDPADSNGTNLSDYARTHNGAGQTQQVQQGGDIPLENLYAAMANPLLNEQQRGVVQMMIQQREQAADPARQLQMQGAQLGLQKTQMEIDQMRNPQPGYRMLTTQEAASMGLPDGAFQAGPDGKVSQIGGGGTNVNVSVGGDGAPGLGKLSSDFGYVLDPETRQPVIDPATGLPTAAPVPGSPAAMEAANLARANAVKGDNKATTGDIITTAATRARDAASKRQFGGFGQSIVAGINPYSDAAEVQRQVNVLKSQAKVTNLQAMRDASPTGGALGAVTAPELQMLADMSGALDPNSPNFARDLDDYERTMLRVVHGQAEGDRIFDAARQGGTAPDAGGWQTINGVKVRVKQ